MMVIGGAGGGSHGLRRLNSAIGNRVSLPVRRFTLRGYDAGSPRGGTEVTVAIRPWMPVVPVVGAVPRPSAPLPQPRSGRNRVVTPAPASATTAIAANTAAKAAG